MCKAMKDWAEPPGDTIKYKSIHPVEHKSTGFFLLSQFPVYCGNLLGRSYGAIINMMRIGYLLWMKFQK